MSKGDQLKRVQAEAKTIAERFGIDYRVAMKACSIARKRSSEVDGTVINEAKESMDAKKNAKLETKRINLECGRVERNYTEFLLKTITDQNATIIELLKKQSHA